MRNRESHGRAHNEFQPGGRITQTPALRFVYGSPSMEFETSPLTHLCMQTIDLPRHQLIKKLTAQRHEDGTDAAVSLWTQMAAQLILIIGAGGFDSLYARSVHLSQSSYPWLAVGSDLLKDDHCFSALKKSLSDQPPALATEANCLLLLTFTNILALMIGESLTTRILNSAWDIDPQDTTDKEENDA
jgi:hypothetical protein